MCIFCIEPLSAVSPKLSNVSNSKKEALLPNTQRDNDSDNEIEYDSDYKERTVKRTWSEHKAADKQFYESKKYTFSL